MTDREKAIVMAHTGICMLTGDKFQIFHKYVEDIMGRPIWTHEIGIESIANEIKEKSKDDFIALCADESSSEKTKSEWQHDHEILKAYSDGASAVLESIKYLIEQYEHYLELLDADMKDGSATIVTKTKYAVYTEVVKQLKEVLESEDKA